MPSKKAVTTFRFEGQRYYVRADTKAEADILAALKKKELEDGKLHRETAMTVNEWFSEYLQVYKAGASDKTVEDYGYCYKNGIRPYIGTMLLRNVKPLHCQQVMNANASRSASYIHKVSILLKGMFAAAADNDLINRNPAAKIKKPSGYSSTRRALTPQERKTFLAASYLAGDAGLFCRIIYYCGLRPSEVSRIRGGDWKNGRLHVRGTKTAAADRLVPIPDALELPETDPGELLFYTSNGGERDKAGARRYWTKVKTFMMNSGPVADDLTLYCLRHDYCTRLQEAGVAINIAREWMGHSSIEITAQIYTHGTDEAFSAAVKLVNAAEKPVAPRLVRLEAAR